MGGNEVIKIFDAKINHLHNPLGIDTAIPRFSWKMDSDQNDVLQMAYQLQTASEEDFIVILWDTGKVESDQSIAVHYQGPVLTTAQRVYWRVKVWTGNEESEYSEPRYFEMGLLKLPDWKASWIEMEEEVDYDAYMREPIIRKSFQVKKGLKKARIYATAHGLYQFRINGIVGTGDLFLPGRTVYTKRLQYQVYDITQILAEGENVLAVLLGDGWWRGSNSAENTHNAFGYKLGFLGQISLEYEDGTSEMITSDSSFRYLPGPLLRSDTKAGEIYNAVSEPTGWDCPGYDDSTWKPTLEMKYAFDNLIATSSVPVRAVETFQPIVLHTPDGSTVLDFGQNITGYVSFRVDVPAGIRIRMVHSEVLNKEGNFTIAHYQGWYALQSGREEPFQEEVYIAKGKGVESFCPLFGVYGFRYVLLEGYPGEPDPADFTAHAVYSAMEAAGTFTCSDENLNRLVQNSLWSQKGNFLEIPTDCPTRERAGWTGDAQVYCKTASDFMDTYTFYEKWMQDVAADQAPTGKILNITPGGKPYIMEEIRRQAICHGEKDDETLTKKLEEQYGQGELLDGSSGWGDVAVILPWTIYQVYGDPRIIENQYESAKKWVDYIIVKCKNPNPHYKDAPWYPADSDGDCDGNYIWDNCFHWGEWLEPDSKANASGDQAAYFTEMIARQMTIGEPPLTTAFSANSAHIVAQMAAVLGKEEDAAYYDAIFKRMKRIYNACFIKEDGCILEDRQAPQARTLALGIAEEDKIGKVAAKLNEYVEKAGFHLNTGFLSTKYLLPMLTEYGYKESAYRVLEQDKYPSWLFQVKNGATTMCESWSCYTPGMEPFASCNHYSYGAVCDYMFSYIAGIRLLEPGYKKFLIQPVPGGTLTYAKAEYESPYGTITSVWKIENSKTVYKFTIPANTKAVIRLKVNEEEAEHLSREISASKYEEGIISLEVGSGRYVYTVKS